MSSETNGDQKLQRLFQRHSRSQHPTVQTSNAPKSRILSARSSLSWEPPPLAKSLALTRAQSSDATWLDFVQLGVLSQAGGDLVVCSPRDNRGTLMMFRCLGEQEESSAKRLLDLQHPSLVQPRCLILGSDSQHIGFDYTRFTLEEILNVHVRLEEIHLRAMVQSVFPAIKYLNEKRYSHGNITTHSIRLCGRTGRIFLDNVENCKHQERPLSTDLEDFGLVLLKCMEGDTRRVRTAEEVRAARATNKVFGIVNAERWSANKQLIDFIDDIFWSQRKIAEKFARPHEFVTTNQSRKDVCQPLVEVASLECFTMWRATPQSN